MNAVTTQFIKTSLEECNMNKLTKLFEPLKIGNIEIRNRMVFLALGTVYGAGGLVNDQYKNFILERARGGAI